MAKVQHKEAFCTISRYPFFAVIAKTLSTSENARKKQNNQITNHHENNLISIFINFDCRVVSLIYIIKIANKKLHYYLTTMWSQARTYYN